MARQNADGETDSETDRRVSRARAAARRAASEVEQMGSATRDVPDPKPPSASETGSESTSSNDSNSSKNNSSASSKSSKSSSAASSDINRGRRTKRGSSTSSSNSASTSRTSTSSSTARSSTPDNINQGRRVDRTTQTQTESKSESESGTDDTPTVRDSSAGQSSQQQSSNQTAETRQEIREQVVSSNVDITDTDQVQVSDIQRTDDGVTADVSLTEEGKQQVREGQRKAVARMGTTGQRMLARQRARQQAETQRNLADDVRGNQLAREQLRQEFAEDSRLDSSDVNIDVDRSGVDVSLTQGGQQRETVRRAAQSSEVDADDIKATTTRDGETRAELTDDAVADRVAANNDDLDRDDIRVTDEREFQSDAGVFAAAGKDVPRETRRSVELTEEAKRERLRDQVEQEFPNAESIDIVTDGDGLRANVETEGDVSRAVRIGEQFVAAPASSTIEGTQDIVRGSENALTQLGNDTIKATTNPVRTTRTASADFVSGAESIGSDFVSGVKRDASAVADITGEITASDGATSGTAPGPGVASAPGTDLAQSSAESILDSGFLQDTARRSKSVATSPAVAPIAAPVTGAALAEPTPLGEIGVGTAAGVGVLAVGGTVAAERGIQALDSSTSTSVTRRSELGVGDPNTAVNELEPGENTQTELDVGEFRPGTEVGVGETVMSTELDTPDQDVTGEISVPTISTRQMQQQRQQERDPREITREEISEPLGEPERRPPSVRERQRRDNLFTPERTFPTGGSAVIGSGSSTGIEQSEFTTPDVDATEGRQELETGVGGVGDGFRYRGELGLDSNTDTGVSQTPDVGIDTDTGVDTTPAVASRSRTATRTALSSDMGAELEQPNMPTEFGTENAFGNPNEFGFSERVAFGESNTGFRRPRRFDPEDGDDDDDEFGFGESTERFSTGFRDFDIKSSFSF